MTIGLTQRCIDHKRTQQVPFQLSFLLQVIAHPLRRPGDSRENMTSSSAPSPQTNLTALLASSLSPSLNKLQAKVLRARLMSTPDADALEKQFEEEQRRAHGASSEGGVRKKVEILPTVDGKGRLYDLGNDQAPAEPERKEKRKVFLILFYFS